MTHNDPEKFSLRSPLAHARGMGSAKEGSHHWWVQRMTAIVLIPLTFWLVTSLILMVGQPYPVVRAWFGNMFVTVFLALGLFALFYHAILGIQVIIEDYVDHEGPRLMMFYIIKGFIYVVGALTIFATLRMGFGL